MVGKITIAKLYLVGYLIDIFERIHEIIEGKVNIIEETDDLHWFRDVIAVLREIYNPAEQHGNNFKFFRFYRTLQPQFVGNGWRKDAIKKFVSQLLFLLQFSCRLLEFVRDNLETLC